VFRRIFAVVSSLACATATLAAEDIHFLVEHAVESEMDAAYMALPWPTGRLAPGDWQRSVDLAAAHTTTAFMRVNGSVVAAAAARGVGARWGYELMASYGEFSVSGGDGRVPLSSRFFGEVPLDLPQLADFSEVRGTQRQLDVGAAAVHERHAAERAFSTQLIAGLLLERVDITPLRMDYRLVDGADAGVFGTLAYASRASFVTPFVALQQTRPLAPRWSWSLRAMLTVPVPPRTLDARLTGPQFDSSTPPAGRAIEIGDPFVVVGLAFRHRPSGLEIDLGGRAYYAQAESASHRGVDGARVLHVAWRHGTG
jgi:hypothetical protein